VANETGEIVLSMRDLRGVAAYAAERIKNDIEAETELAVEEVIDMDAIKAAMVEKFKDSYHLPDSLPEELRKVLNERVFGSWRGVLHQWVQKAGFDLRSEFEEAVREALPAHLTE
jgi:hypothetical protein